MWGGGEYIFFGGGVSEFCRGSTGGSKISNPWRRESYTFFRHMGIRIQFS